MIACVLLAVVTSVSLAAPQRGGRGAQASSAQNRPLERFRVQQAQAEPKREARERRSRRRAPRQQPAPEQNSPQGSQPRVEQEQPRQGPTRRRRRPRRPREEKPQQPQQPQTPQTPQQPQQPAAPDDDEPQGGRPAPSPDEGSAGGTTTTPRAQRPAPSAPPVTAPRRSLAQPTRAPAPAATGGRRPAELRPFGIAVNAGPARPRTLSRSRPKAAASPTPRLPDLSAQVEKGVRGWGLVAGTGGSGRQPAEGRSRQAGRAAPEQRAAPEPCPAGSCDVVTELVAFVPGVVKLAIGLLGVLALAFLAATVVSRRKLAEARTRAVTDALTGLPDHSAIHDELTAMVAAAKRAGAPLAVVLIDLDKFKRINDTYGHLKGDEVLRAVSDKARHELRAGDFVGRYGGEEFMAILPDTERAGAVAVVDRLRRTFWELEIAGVRELVTASMGVATFPVDGTRPNELIEAADDALYAAKGGGRNQVRTATPLDRPSESLDLPGRPGPLVPQALGARAA